MKTVCAVLCRQFYFKGLQRAVTSNIRTCDQCQRCKEAMENLVGAPQAIIPQRPLQLVSVDLFGPLPKSRGKVLLIFVILVKQRLKLTAEKQGHYYKTPKLKVLEVGMLDLARVANIKQEPERLPKFSVKTNAVSSVVFLVPTSVFTSVPDD
ncbi:hypothetical protein PR048_024949 [Dryococelus australis]|uniref:Integrase zinc-binding domain-containing protein n=1 Tax=Dryococelus australis TaxID=614101 RepID=A0ABQ9GQ20_9NEOP|nr:hypothetical protein PR048_024949 [Dryococelus australis]